MKLGWLLPIALVVVALASPVPAVGLTVWDMLNEWNYRPADIAPMSPPAPPKPEPAEPAEPPFEVHYDGPYPPTDRTSQDELLRYLAFMHLWALRCVAHHDAFSQDDLDEIFALIIEHSMGLSDDEVSRYFGEPSASPAPCATIRKWLSHDLPEFRAPSAEGAEATSRLTSDGH